MIAPIPVLFTAPIKAVIFRLPSEVQSGPLSLTDALRIAEENAFALKISATQIEKARQQAAQARGQLGPRLTAEGTYTRFDKALTANFGGASITTRPIDNKDAKLNFSMPLDIAGVTGKAVRAAQLNIAVQEANLEAARNDLHQNVKRAFFGVLQSQAAITVSEEALARAKDRLKNVRAEMVAGTRAKVDVIRIETTVAQAEADLTVAQNQLKLAKSSLNNVLGRAIEAPLEISNPAFWRPAPMSEEDLFKTAKESRPELKAVALQQEVLAFVRLAEERGGVPSLNFSAVHSRTFGSTGFGSSTASTTGVVALSIPIWDSGITRARVKAARQDEEQVKLQGEQLTLAISLQVRQAYANLMNAAARRTLAEQQVKLAEESYRLTTVKFEAGEGIPLEVADAGTQLTQAKTLLVNAQYDYLRAIADLEHAIGKELQPEGTR
ncbi:MAG: TolC family protein [Methanoregulaceae archaeon]|nr:TolC family protein [Methanoregulaceae archaeon]